ncbi:helix-turn-helix transcriptional regulator [Ruicaihuangia caeni]|uniref:WYL domain-containing protein n=1 Tax=Ruicaihuangia caeni TaxID=3042517 RepID=A0AAW6T302_9MICO|nr:WYL domain-containing protein [Klugiella sp. YN-L-19]MDI2098195.1 WYL domain-containing protein [Klugiella sp. YN-L-19]
MAEHPRLPHAQDKLAFLLSLVAYLRDRGRVSVAEAAAHFDVDAAQIREAVRLLVVTGVPGTTKAYQPDDLFDIAWDDFEQDDIIVLTNLVAIEDAPRLSAREASALIAGLQYLAALPEASDRAAIASLTDKLSRGASGAISAVSIEASTDDGALAIIRSAVEHGRRLAFWYRNAKGEGHERRVEPLRVDSVDNDWYLRGWDVEREAVRTYRLDRMSEVRVLDEAADTGRPAAAAVHRLVDDRLFNDAEASVVVTLEVVPAALPLLGEFVSDDAEIAAAGDRVRVETRVAHFHTLKRQVAALPGLVEVLSPPEAREAVRAWARDARAAYDA